MASGGSSLGLFDVAACEADSDFNTGGVGNTPVTESGDGKGGSEEFGSVAAKTNRQI